MGANVRDMREKLKQEDGTRKKFQATFVKFGKKKNYLGYSEETVLLKNIIDFENKKLVADHVWFTYTKNFQAVRLTAGVHIEFEARVKKYRKGYINTRYQINRQTMDYKLSHPTKISLTDG